MVLSIAFSRATASAICRSSSLFALTTILVSLGGAGLPSRGKSIVLLFAGLVTGFVFLAALCRLALLLALLPRLLVLLEGGADKVVGQHQSCLGDRLERHTRLRLLAIGRHV